MAIMSKMWSADHAVRAERRRLVDGEAAFVVDRYAEGYAAGRIAVDAEVAAERAMLLTLMGAAADLKIADPEPLAALLQETVMRLVADVAGAAAVDSALLKERALALAVAIHGPEGPVTLRVHPDCVAMLDGLRSDIGVCGDAGIPAGQIVLSVGAGTAEDGVMSALDRVRAALETVS
jgi:hypothetical protein